MQIKFGMFLDGARWNTGKCAALGKISAGPLNFAAILEEALALDGVKTSVPCRINEYMQKIAKLDSPWCRKSFAADRWSTAKKILEWRDEMFEAGWDGKSSASERQKTIAELEPFENKGDVLTDRLLNILNALGKISFPHEIILDEPFEDLPYLWREILNKLQSAGAKISECEKLPILSPVKIPVSAPDEFALARICARYLAAGDNSRTAVICEGDSAVLDEALHQAGLGRIGNASRSRWRESLQLLPLWLDTLKKPFDPNRFIQLLVIPDSPVPRKLARALAEAIEKEPGFGGEQWHKAWQKIEDAAQSDPDILTDNLKECHKMLDKSSFLYEESIPASEIIARCDFFCRMISGKSKDNDDLKIPLAHAATLKEIMQMYGGGNVFVQELDRIIDSIVSSGTVSESRSEVTDFTVFSNPAMVDEVFDTVIWWNFITPSTAKMSSWSEAEKALLPHLNSAAVRRRENRAWSNVLRKTSKNLILLIPDISNGETAEMHPFGDELKIGKTDKISAETLISADGSWKLAERSVKLEKVDRSTVSGSASIPENDIGINGTLSPTQMETIISCPRRWYLERFLRLKAPSELSIPSGMLMLGKLAHKIVENIYSGKSRLDADEAGRLADAEFDRLLPSMAAELLLQGNTLECMRQKKILVDSVKNLAKELNERGLVVVGNETECRGNILGIEFAGRVDLELRDAQGNPFVIDMKWSYSKDYDDKISSGRAVQLAVYSAIIGDGGTDVRCAYYLFPKNKFAEDSPSSPVDWADVRARAVQAWNNALNEIHSGKIPCGSSKDDLKDSTSPMPIAAQCGYCLFSAWCRTIADENAEAENE